MAKNMTAIRPRINDRLLFGSRFKSISLTTNSNDLVGSDFSSYSADHDLERIESTIGIPFVDVIRKLDTADNRALLLEKVTQYLRFE